VLTGPAIDLFDREFRILFAASVPAPEPLRVTAGTRANLPHQLKDFSHLRSHKQLCVEPETTNPPSPPADSVLDWEAMGVGQGDRCLPGSPLELHDDVMADEIPQHKNDSDRPIMDRFAYKEHQFMDKRRCRTQILLTNPSVCIKTQHKYIQINTHFHKCNFYN